MDDGLDRVRAVLDGAEDVDLPEDLRADHGDDRGHGPGDDLPPPDDGDGGEPVDPIREAARYPLNDLGNGQRFVLHFGADILFVSQVGWFVWDGCRWRRDEEISRDVSPLIRGRAHKMSGLIAQEVRYLDLPERDLEVLAEADLVEDAYAALAKKGARGRDEEEAASFAEICALRDRAEAIRERHDKVVGRRLTHAKNAGNSGPMTNMIAEARVTLARTVDQMDVGDLDVNTLSGVLRFSRLAPDPDEGGGSVAQVELVAHARDQLLTKVMPVTYDRAARCPRFDAFLREIQPDIEMRRFLARWFGLSMTGIDVQKLAFFHGGGANGKSVLVDLMARMMGDYAATARIESLTGRNKKSGSDSQPDLMPLIAARFVRTSEPEEGERLQEGLVKALTGGEPMMIRALYADFITFQPIFKLTISGNHLPDIRGGDDGIWRRVMLVKFPVQIPEERRIPKKELDEILWAERAGILNWLIDGLLDYLDGGLQEPDEVRAATDDYRKDSDPVGTFLTDATVVSGHEGDFITARELIDAFNFWVEERGETRWGNRTVSNRIKAKAGSWRHPDGGRCFAPGKSGVTGYRGIRIGDELRARMDEAKLEGGWGRNG